MKAVVLHEYGSPANLKYEDLPDPIPGPGEVLVRVFAVSLNPIDWKMRSGAVKDHFPLELPAVLGRDLAGVVRHLGEGVHDFEPGDRVMAVASKTYAELCVIKARDLAKIPEDLEITTAGAIPLVAITGDQLIRRGANVQPGQTVVISGALGSVGRCAISAASEIGATVIAAVRSKQLEEARATSGVAHAIAVDDEEAMAQLGQVDSVADTVGGKVAISLLSKVKPDGVFASVVGPPPDALLHPAVKINAIVAQPDVATIRHYAEAVRDNHLSLPIDRMMPLSDAAEAHAIAEKGGIGKIVLLA